VTYLLVFGTSLAASAQQVVPFLPPVQLSARPQPEAVPVPPALADSQSVSTVVSLTRIRRLLREQPPTLAEPKLTVVDANIRVEYRIKVEGRMPWSYEPIGDFNIDKRSAVAHGGMTHAEFLKVVAPPWRKW
jgi:hypothetical protein